MPQRRAAASDRDLIGFLRAIPDAGIGRGIRIRAWCLILVSVLGILNSCQSLRDLGQFANLHYTAMTTSLGIDLKRSLSDTAFRYFFLQMDVRSLCAAIRDWTIAQTPGGAEAFDQLICDNKALRASVEPTAGGGSTFIAQVTLYSAALGLAISQACHATVENHERAVLKQLLGELDLQGLLNPAGCPAHSETFFLTIAGAGA